MPITVACTCGKQLRTADENVGKRIRCPACQALVTVPSPRRSRAVEPARVPRFTLSPMYIVLILLALIIPAILLWVKQGPLNAERQWAGMTQQAQDGIQTYVLRAMNLQYADMGIKANNPDGVHPNPKVSDFLFDEPVMMISLPEAVTFTGHTTEGSVRGTFHPKTMKFECDVEIEKAMHRVTGSTDPAAKEFTFDGKPVK